MQSLKSTSALAAGLACLAGLGSIPTPAEAGESVIYSFTGGSDGGGPSGALVFDPAGNAYGTTHFGGITTCGGGVGGGCGVVFVLTPSKKGWSESVLYAFADGADGGFPNSGVILDKAGDVYGTASTGGNFACSIGCGVVYELARSGNKFSENVLHTFGGADGQFPNAILVASKKNTLFSTTWYGGSSGNGTVFELAPHGKGSWSESLLLSLPGGAGGAYPAGGVIFDAAGDLFGTTYPYDGSNDGVVYELAHGKGSEVVLHSFGGSGDGDNPYAGLIGDSKGNLYGTTIAGGANGSGIVFELSRSKHGNTWNETILHDFGGSGDGSQPYAGLVMDRRGNFYGATLFGGSANAGTIYELQRKHGAWIERILYDFTGGADGKYPSATPTLDASGSIFGTTENGGAYGYGVVFELTP